MSEEQQTTETVAPASGMRWYVVHAYSGMEKAVERNLRERIDRAGMQAKFGRILVPTEEVVELKNGKKSVSERRFFPGYVLVEMLMDDDSWHLVKHTSKVTGFVGGARNRPAPKGRPVDDVDGAGAPTGAAGYSISMKMHSPGHSSAASMQASSWPAGTLARPAAPPGSENTLAPSLT